MGTAEVRPIEWTEDLKIGIPIIDADHKVLVSLLNQVFETVGDREEKATLGSVLNSLVDYTEYHFAREERLQEVAGYGGLAGHKALHRDLTAQVVAIRTRFEQDPESVHGEEVLNFLRSWLVDHINGHDMAYRGACVGNEVAIKAATGVAFDHAEGDDYEDDGAPLVDWARVKVLVVEDNRNFQIIIQTILKSLGVRDITMAGNGEEGLAALAAAVPDLVLCDWRMEAMDGIEFVSQARAGGSQAKIIMMSGYSDDDVRDRAVAAGVDDFLEKPITARGFLDAATSALSR
ncbi:bacteriohemerythrin [Caenispirillum bisanense]|uniref:Hemerythrin-like metal-binding domain protein n=1 Tax=Caenispirillum bisanense TaxID=414052 RepID=A0A286H110_9PROT|nr:bacteriohemerythrin [Caenispirillum bisanense]SOE01146.1 hemerythrin-like metal-binding domain protein [Caenispirillum bisanense]